MLPVGVWHAACFMLFSSNIFQDIADKKTELREKKEMLKETTRHGL